MMNVYLFMVCFVFFHDCGSSVIKNGTRAVPSLKFLIVVGKHGARTPTHSYPTDPYRNISLWPDGKGQVTRVGKQQMYRLGRKLRHLYNGFISHMYHASQVMAQSTVVDRTMISAATMLAGLFPPQGQQRWHPNITWQPVPVYPNLLDKTLVSLDPRSCPRYWVEQNRSLIELVHQSHRYQDLYNAVSQGCGRNISSCSQLYLLSQNFACVVDNGLSLPSWAEAIFVPHMLPVVSQIVRDTTFKNAKMLRILSGLFLGKIAELLQVDTKMDSAMNDTVTTFLHVGHDLILMCLLASLGLRDQPIPWSGSALLLELHHNPSLPSNYQVQVLKIDGRVYSYSAPEVVELPTCPTPCDRATFIGQLSKYSTIVTDWRRECLDLSSPSD